ncbi:hypothetical protein L7F22_038113 [Adiantum nelumboides]|nr:hypothetical protein [Adiantum nelumboides]
MIYSITLRMIWKVHCSSVLSVQTSSVLDTLLNFPDLSYEELYDMFLPSEGRIEGASEEVLQSLPKHVITQTNRRDACGDVLGCAICLQELEQGDMARTLPECKHTFHLQCVDRWLAKHVICPVCRRYFQ